MKDAVGVLQDSRKLADDVASWQPQSQGFSASNGPEGDSAGHNTDRNGSRYRESATEIRDAATQLLTRIDPSSVPAAPVAPASPSPH